MKQDKPGSKKMLREGGMEGGNTGGGVFNKGTQRPTTTKQLTMTTTRNNLIKKIVNSIGL